MNSVYKAQCKSFKLAQELTGITGNTSRGFASFKPPFCLRVLRGYRTTEMVEFRNLVATKLKEQRCLKN